MWVPSVSKGVLKARLLEMLRDLERQGGELIITDFNRPVLKVTPFKPQQSLEEAFGRLRAGSQVPELPGALTWDEWST